jgi:hypothetical protein
LQVRRIEKIQSGRSSITKKMVERERERERDRQTDRNREVYRKRRFENRRNKTRCSTPRLPLSSPAGHKKGEGKRKGKGNGAPRNRGKKWENKRK